MSDLVVDRAIEFMHAHLKGLLSFDEHVRDVRIVIAPSGRVIAPVMVAMIEAVDTVLYLPDEDDESLHLTVTVDPFDEHGRDGALADRWRIYHGDPPDIRWSVLTVDAARFESQIIDGAGMLRANGLAAFEAELCRLINARGPDPLRRVLRIHGQVETEAPRLVGVDARGFDIRGQFDVYRVASAEPMGDRDAALAMFDRLADGAAG